MSSEAEALTRDRLLRYVQQGAKPRAGWKVGMEVEKLGRDAATGAPLPYDGPGPSVRRVLEHLRDRHRAEPVLEDGRIIGLQAPWGEVSLEPGGQVEWSSRPYPTLGELKRRLDEHLAALSAAGAEVGVSWIELGMDPEHPVEAMPWMPKERYRLMRSYLGARGRLAHRMMTQTASVQCAFDHAGPEDWARKFRAGAFLSPLALALFANSSRVDGRESGYRSYRQAIWRDTDPDRCGLPASVFRSDFGFEHWLDYVLDVPLLFRRTPRGLAPSGGVTFRRLMESEEGPSSLRMIDWETHVSTIFTELRSYTYIEVRSADLQPGERAFEVPAFWTGVLYHEDGIEHALDVGARLDHAGWTTAMESAARSGLDGAIGGRPLREVAKEALGLAVRNLGSGIPCVDDPAGPVRAVRSIAERLGLDVGS